MKSNDRPSLLDVWEQSQKAKKSCSVDLDFWSMPMDKRCYACGHRLGVHTVDSPHGCLGTERLPSCECPGFKLAPPDPEWGYPIDPPDDWGIPAQAVIEVRPHRPRPNPKSVAFKESLSTIPPFKPLVTCLAGEPIKRGDPVRQGSGGSYVIAKPGSMVIGYAVTEAKKGQYFSAEMT